MSHANVELARRVTDAFLDGDWDAALGLLHRDVEFEAAARPDAGVWRGRDGVRRAVAEWVGTWDEYALEIREYVDAPDDRVLVLWTERGRGRASGIAIEHHGGYVMSVRDGEIVRIALYVDTDEAFAAAGLSE